MRKDMFKVIVERPRKNPKRYKKGRQKNMEDLPQKESMRKKYDWNWNRKELNENLKPLVRFLKSRVGKKWDSVFSEICENLKLDSAVQKHVRDHVFDYVRINVKKEGKNLFHMPKYYGKWVELWNDDLYVDPDTGILKIYKIKKKERYKPDYLGDYLKQISTSKSQTLIEDGQVFKLYFDKISDSFSIKHKSTKKHAQVDFEDKKGAFSNNLVSLKKALDYIHTKLKINKNDYFTEYYRLVNEGLANQEIKKRPQYFKAGDKVKFQQYATEPWQEGIINLIHYTDDGSQYLAYVTVGTKNVSVHSTSTRLIKV